MVERCVKLQPDITQHVRLVEHEAQPLLIRRVERDHVKVLLQDIAVFEAVTKELQQSKLTFFCSFKKHKVVKQSHYVVVVWKSEQRSLPIAAGGAPDVFPGGVTVHIAVNTLQWAVASLGTRPAYLPPGGEIGVEVVHDDGVDVFLNAAVGAPPEGDELPLGFVVDARGRSGVVLAASKSRDDGGAELDIAGSRFKRVRDTRRRFGGPPDCQSTSMMSQDVNSVLVLRQPSHKTRERVTPSGRVPSVGKLYSEVADGSIGEEYVEIA
ncbi:hypothetical protein PC116_g5406 [Phytophthora cactorum]|nr:hypothetical protein PC128_g2966 [Phytophthora cactorum]KAG4246843.1 hypothetical protein PC116_g5406 [Phytophthora cactorum]